MSGSDLNLLLVEDNPGDARIIIEMLKRSQQISYAVTAVERISAAVSALSSYNFDTVILDLNLPDSSGLETLDTIIIKTKSIVPIIVMTGLNDEETGLAAIEHGAEDYLIKGEVNTGQLIRSIRYAIERKRSESAVRESEARYRELVHNANSAIIRWKSDGTLTFFNEYAQNLFGYTAEEVIGKHVSIIVPEIDLHGHDLSTLVQDIVDSPEQYSYNINENVCSDGRRIWMAWSNKPIFSDSKIVEILAVGSDITERKIAETALIESERRLKEAQSMARVGDWEFDLTNQKITWSDQVYRMYERDPHLGPPTPEEEAAYYTSGEAAVLQRAAQKAIDTGNNVDYEFNLTPASGKTLVFAGAMSPVKDATGNVIKIFGTLQDITERNKILDDLRTSLDEKKELIREIYHRTKNNLQVIISMFTLQSIFSADEKLERVLKNMENRIRAMSLVHEKLYQSKNLSKLDLRDYLSDLAHNIISGYGINGNKILIIDKMKNMEVLIDTAIPCGLVFDELISNVAKHAFPGDRKGELQISLLMDKAGKIELVVGDNGAGKGLSPDIENTESMGFQIISNIVEYQLQGEFKLDTAAGMKWTISFKDNIYEERV